MIVNEQQGMLYKRNLTGMIGCTLTCCPHCPVLQDVHLDVAAVREELKSYQKWTSQPTNHTACSSVVAAALTHCQRRSTAVFR